VVSQISCRRALPTSWHAGGHRCSLLDRSTSSLCPLPSTGLGIQQVLTKEPQRHTKETVEC
jgi:hypothetical protein